MKRKSYRRFFTKEIGNSYPNKSDFLIAETDKNFNHISKDTKFALRSANPIDRRLDFSAYFLALVKTLDAQGENFESIREICLRIVIEYVRPKNKMELFLKRIPAKLINTWLANLFLKAFNKRINNKANPDGFVAKIITGKGEAIDFDFGFDILECGICKLFKKHNYEKYASILCEVDEVTSGLAGLELTRTGTIALGAKKCDFRFKKEIPIKR